MGRVAAFGVYAFLVAPIMLVVGSSLTAGGYIRFPPEGLSLRWYSALVHDRDMVQGIALSVEIGLVTVTIGLVVGTMAGLYLSRPDVVARHVWGTVFMSPLAVPLVLTGFAMLVLFTRLRLVNPVGLVIAHVVVTVPYVVRTVMTSLSLADPSLPKAAAIHGANPWRVFWHVSLPLLRPGLVAGGLFAFLASFNNITISIFISAPGTSPLPVVIFNRMENLAEPSSAAAASVVILLTAAGVWVLERWFSLFGALLGAGR